MRKFHLIALSKFNHQENWLGLALNNLIESGLASTGFDGNREQLITILYDKDDNPYLLFNSRYINIVKEEVEKRIIRPEIGFIVDSFESSQAGLDFGIHEIIQKIYTPKKLYTACAN